MIDHVLGRPSPKFRKIQVLTVLSFWSLYLYKGNENGPPKIRALSRRLSILFTPWQIVTITLLYLYTVKNFSSLIGLENPEPLANLYTRSYFRATWVTTAMDAGFWTAMRIKRKWLRDICSVIFTLYYLVAAEQADEKVRKVRGVLTLDHLRVSWNKGTTPYLGAIQALFRPRLMKYPPRQIRIPRPAGSYYKEPVHAWLYFDGPLSELAKYHKIVLDVPGGGFVAMSPRANDDKLFGWAGKTGLPVLSLDYRKAPEYPYPYAINECFDVYQSIVASRGRCVGMSGEIAPKIVLTGDSAGGNLAAATVLMIIESGSTEARQRAGETVLPIPEGLILIYPGLDMNIGNWMSDEQMSLIKDRKMRRLNKDMIRQKSMQYTHLAGTPHQTDDEDEGSPPESTATPINTKEVQEMNENASTPAPEMSSATISPLSANTTPDTAHHARQPSSSDHSQPMHTRLAMSSMLSYFNDRILTPEMMRAMIILYIGPHNRPDFSKDYLLSPILAPDELLSRFPKTYFLTGEVDPLVDDTVIFAGRLRRAKAWRHQREALEDSSLAKEFDFNDVVEVVLIPAISHGFMQFCGCFPEGWKHIFRCARWIDEIFADSDAIERGYLNIPAVTPAGCASRPNHRPGSSSFASFTRHHRRKPTESSGDEDFGLEMSMTSRTSRGEKIRESKPETERERDRLRKRKERLLREQLVEKKEKRRKEKTLGRDGLPREKSMVTLASSDDLLGRRMLGLAGALTGMGDGGDKG